MRGTGVLPPARVCAKGSKCVPDKRITPTPPRPGAVAMAAMVGEVGDMGILLNKLCADYKAECPKKHVAGLAGF